MNLTATGSLFFESVLLVSDQFNESDNVSLDLELGHFENDQHWFEPEMQMKIEDDSNVASSQVPVKEAGNYKQGSITKPDCDNNNTKPCDARLEQINVTKKRKRGNPSLPPLPRLPDVPHVSNDENKTKFVAVSEPAQQNTAKKRMPSVPEFIHTNEIENYSTVQGECLLCGKNLSSRTSVIRHIKLSHLRLSEWVCPLCLAVYREKKGVKEHLITHHSKSTASFGTIKYVPMVGRFPIYQSFSGRYALPSEMEGVLPDTSFNSMDTSDIFVTEKQRLNGRQRDAGPVMECPYCDQDFKTASSLRRHKRGVHRDQYQRDKALEEERKANSNNPSEAKKKQLEEEQMANYTLQMEIIKEQERKYLETLEAEYSYKLPCDLNSDSLLLQDEALFNEKLDLKKLLPNLDIKRKLSEKFIPSLSYLNQGKAEFITPKVFTERIVTPKISRKIVAPKPNINKDGQPNVKSVKTIFNAAPTKPVIAKSQTTAKIDIPLIKETKLQVVCNTKVIPTQLKMLMKSQDVVLKRQNSARETEQNKENQPLTGFIAIGKAKQSNGTRKIGQPSKISLPLRN